MSLIILSYKLSPTSFSHSGIYPCNCNISWTVTIVTTPGLDSCATSASAASTPWSDPWTPESPPPRPGGRLPEGLRPYMFMSLLLCHTINIYSASGPLALSVVPRGSCPLCCSADLRRDVSFLLFTRSNPHHGQRLYIDGYRELSRSFLRRNSSTVFYIHGFTETSRSRSSQTIKTAFLQRGDYNVILVDWSPLSAAPWYRPAAQNARPVGLHLARFVHFLHRSAVPVHHMHVVGFSLGAEVAGFAGKALHDLRLPRITGLDPAYPLYRMAGWRGHLTATDARFVDVIHTDGGVFGFRRPLGHVDFYPNGGIPFQPGCTFIELLGKMNLRGYVMLRVSVACSHNRAWAYFAESILDPFAFPAVRCPSFGSYKMGMCHHGPPLQYMGVAADPRQEGKFYLSTRDEPPYSLRKVRWKG
ncbi:phospholipase A1-like [Macrosteles quadrilineatus]|uniref:phospholipase A1-like n=1 Tax=Macrosteles quadrilineatus TaxID=74068 RepID=UPI0023E0A6C8|nr:phospholipase A1-like [Macrosteles quadrilineatus]